jgi:hypothetical protein
MNDISVNYYVGAHLVASPSKQSDDGIRCIIASIILVNPADKMRMSALGDVKLIIAFYNALHLNNI